MKSLHTNLCKNKFTQKNLKNTQNLKIPAISFKNLIIQVKNLIANVIIWEESLRTRRGVETDPRVLQ